MRENSGFISEIGRGKQTIEDICYADKDLSTTTLL